MTDLHFHNQAEVRFFAQTTKAELFEMLREAAALLASLQIDGYEPEQGPAWIWQAQHVGTALPDDVTAAYGETTA